MLLGECPVIDPFIHVMTEMAIVVPGGAMLFAGAAMIRNRFRNRHLIPNHATEMFASTVVEGGSADGSSTDRQNGSIIEQTSLRPVLT